MLAVPHLQLEHGILWVIPDGLDRGPGHQVEQAQDKVCTLAQDVIRLTAEHAEVVIIGAVLYVADQTANHTTANRVLHVLQTQ